MRLQLVLQRVLRIECLGRLLSSGTDTGGDRLVIPIQRRIVQRTDRSMLQIGQGQGIRIVAGKAPRAIRGRNLSSIG